MTVKETLVNELISRWGEIDPEVIKTGLEVPKDKKMGDFAFPCFRLSKTMRKAPALIALDLKEKLTNDGMIEKAEVVGPYLNLTLKKAFFAQQILAEIEEADKEGKGFGSSDEGNGKTVVLDYSSINVAKPFHIGHLRTTVIGNSLTRILKFLGYNTVSMNYLGDWGTQFGKMLVAYRKWGDSAEVEKNGIRYLVQLYVRFHDEAEKDPSLEEEARAAFKSMELGDQEALKLWRYFVDISLKDVKRVYELLDVSFDSYLGESYFWDKTDDLIQELEEKQLLQDSNGAKIVDLGEEMPPCLILKKDGSTLYATRDIASAMYRKATYDFYKSLYITGLEQKLHFAQWFKVVDMMGRDWAKDLVHIPYGLISLKEGKLSTRHGNVIWLEDLLKEAIQKTTEIMKEKNPDLEDMEEVAKEVGVGAVVFHDLFNNRIKEVTFDWDEVLNFDGETGPYVQYTFARASSVLRKAGFDPENAMDIDMEELADEYSQDVLKLLEVFPEKVKEALSKYEPYIITRYTVALASSFNRFYHANAILNAEEKTKNARLKLTYVTTKVLKQGLYLIGVAAPEKM